MLLAELAINMQKGSYTLTRTGQRIGVFIVALGEEGPKKQ
jgi:hypothetical protein